MIIKTIKFVGYLFYRYYAKGPRASFPYFSTLCSMTFLGYIHLFQILILLNSVDLIPINPTNSKLFKRLIMFFVMLPIFFLITQLFKKSDIVPLKEKYDNNWDKVYKGNTWLVIYIIISIALIFILAILKKN